MMVLDTKARGSVRLVAVVAMALAVVSSLAGAAEAQGFVLDRFHGTEAPEDGFALAAPVARGDDYWAAQLMVDYANNPLVYESTLGDASTETTSIVLHQVVMRAGISWSLYDRLLLYAGLPIGLVMTGDEVAGVPTGDDSMLGDPYLGARVRLYGDPLDLFAVALQMSLVFPLANAIDEDQAYTGEMDFAFVPKLLMELRPGPVRVRLNLGARLRGEEDIRDVKVRNEFTWGAGLIVPILESEDRLDAMLEVTGASAFDSFTRRETTNVEALIGAKYYAGGGLVAGLAAGPGFSRGYGTPDARIVLTLGFIEPETVRAPEPEPPPPDRDHDGVTDEDDACPDDPEDEDGDEDEDGCPDLDRDGDGVLDADDQCVDEPEDADEHEDEDGCPDPDNDTDGVLDGDDQCVNEAEDRDGFADEDGCPDLDNDQDGVPDADDECPTAPGPAEARGCPAAVRIDTETGQIRILQRIEFATNRATLLPTAEPILEEVRATLAVNPQIRRLRVEGHTDDRGPDARNLTLSQGRAETVMKWLVDHQIGQERLEAYGCGETRRLAEGTSADARQTNRRVEFHLLDPAPPSGPRSTEGCVAVELPAPTPEPAAPEPAATEPTATP
jgi:outer membrane protein OmpA-like peptidoglycan-associated protein